MASNASQTAMIRDPSGIASPARPSGYPAPSMRSCVERTSAATLESTGAAFRIASPIVVCRRIISHSDASSGPGLCRIDRGMTILPMS